jgi:hypothetical protein
VVSSRISAVPATVRFSPTFKLNPTPTPPVTTRAPSDIVLDCSSPVNLTL